MKAPITPAQAWAAIAEASGWDVATKLEQSQAERIAELERESETHSKAYGLAIVERDNLRHELKTAQEGWRCECSTDDACRFARERDALRAELEKQQVERLLRIEAGVDALVAERDALRAQLAEIEKAEPVAYQRIDPETKERIWDEDSFSSHPNDLDDCIPLFTCPMPAQDVTELVDALERVLNCCDIAECGTVPNSPGALKNARTALSKYKGAK